MIFMIQELIFDVDDEKYGYFYYKIWILIIKSLDENKNILETEYKKFKTFIGN